MKISAKYIACLIFLIFIYGCDTKPNLENTNAVANKSSQIRIFKLEGVSDLAGGGYEQQYSDDDNKSILESRYCFKNPEDLIQEFDKIIKESKTVLEKKEDVQTYFGKAKIKYIVTSSDLRYGNYAIVWRDESDCFMVIFSPNLELALDFENWRNSRSKLY